VSELNDYATRDDFFLTHTIDGKTRKIELEEDVMNGKREVRASVTETRKVLDDETQQFIDKEFTEIISVPVDKIRVSQRNS